MGVVTVKGVAQMLVAEPTDGEAALKLAQLFRYGQQRQGLRMRLWMPPATSLRTESPWFGLAQPGVLQTRLHPAPAVLLLSDAADWRAAQAFYGERPDLPKIHLLHRADLRQWGHGAFGQPAIRVALGEAVAQALQRNPHIREPIQVMPLGLDPEDLPPAPLVKDGCLVLARDQPALGLALHQALQAQGIPATCELSPWPLCQWQQAMAAAEVVVVLASAQSPGLDLRRLAAMALGTVVVMDALPSGEGLCRDGENALIRLADVQELCLAVQQVLDDEPLRRRLLTGGRSTILRYRTARERLCFNELIDSLADHWSMARASHRGR
jgi:hypothetical protein